MKQRKNSHALNPRTTKNKSTKFDNSFRQLLRSPRYIIAGAATLGLVTCGFIYISGKHYIEHAIKTQVDRQFAQLQVQLAENLQREDRLKGIDVAALKQMLDRNTKPDRNGSNIRDLADQALLDAQEAADGALLFRDSAKQALADISELKNATQSTAGAIDRILLQARTALAETERLRSMTEVAAIDTDNAQKDAKIQLTSMVTDALFVKGFAERSREQSKKLEELLIEASTKRETVSKELDILTKLLADIKNSKQVWRDEHRAAQAALVDYESAKAKLAEMNDTVATSMAALSATKKSAEDAANEAAKQAGFAEMFRNQSETASSRTEELRAQLQDAVAIADQAAKDVAAFKRTAGVLALAVQEYRRLFDMSAAAPAAAQENPG